MSLMSDYHSRSTRSRAMSIHQSGVYAGTILGSWLGAWLAAHYGWRSGFYLFGIAGMVLALMLYSFLREPTREATRIASDPAPGIVAALGDVFRVPTAIVLLLVFVGANGVAGVFLFWTPMFLINKFGFALATAGLIWVSSNSCMAIAWGSVQTELGLPIRNPLCCRSST
jgi:predicted MFS family arabinose efflux permease